MTIYTYCPGSIYTKARCTLQSLLLAACLLLMPFTGHANFDPESSKRTSNFDPEPSGQTSNFELRTSNYSAPPNWTINPSDFQFSMNMVIRINYNNVPSNDPGNIVGVFVGAQLRGVATPTNVGGQMYYFVTIYSNQYTGDILRFSAYYAPDDKVYSVQESIPFYHHNSSVGTLLQPFGININPNADFAPEILPIPADTTLQNIPFDPIDLAGYLLSLDGDPVTWSVLSGPNLTATIVNGIMTVTPVSPAWTGTETVQIKVTENTPNQYIFFRTASFTVLPDYGPPVFQSITDQTIFPGGAFTGFDLDNYLSFNGPCHAFGFEVFPYTGADPDPAWPAVPPMAQSMNVVVRPLFANQALAGPGAKLAAFVNNVLVGTATPVGIPPNVSYAMSLQNLAAGPITFRFYHAENQYLYEITTALNFVPGGSAGTVSVPYQIQLSPLLPTLAPDGTVQVSIVDSAWLGTYPVDFFVWDCAFSAARRDTVRVLFSVTEDNRPQITSPPAISYQENACAALYDAQATDPNDSEGNGLTYSLNGGADAGKFSIDPATGQLSWFNFIPDFEAAGDANGDNQYEVIIRVTNLLNITDDLALTVTVTDGPEGVFLPQINGGTTAICLVGSAMLQATGGGTYLWSTSSTNAAITVNTPGTYTVTVTSVGGCTASASISVSNRPTITIASIAPPICIGADINFNSIPAGGSGTYTSFSWLGPNNFSASIEDPAPFQAFPLTVGVYTVTVTDDAGCTATATTTVAVSGSSAPTISAMNNGPLCAGVNLGLSSIPSGGTGTYSQFKWAGPNNYNSSQKNPVGFPVTLVATGTYTVTVTDNAGCTATGTTAVQVNALPAIAVMSNSPLCVGGTVMLSSTPSGGSGGGYTFTWAGPNGFMPAQEDPAGFPAITNATGTYSVTVTDGLGCTATGTTAVSVNGLPTITAMLLSPVCTGGSVALSSSPAGGSVPYAAFLWSGPNGFNAMVEDPAAFPVIPAVAGAYTVTVTDQAGCTATAGLSVVVHPVPVITAMNSGPVCQGANLTLSSTASAGSGIFSLFQWTGPDNYVASIEDPAAFSTTSSSAGVYQVKVTDSEGCTATATTTVMINTKPTITAGSNSPVCAGANIDLKSNPAGGSGTYSTFSWSGPSYTASQQNPPGFTASLTSTGTYRITVTDNAGCTATASTSVAVSSNPAPAITAMSNSPVCGGANIVLTSTPSGGSGVFSQFKWSGPNAYAATQEDPAAFVATAAAAGAYTVTVTDNKGCVGTGSATVVVNAPTATPVTNTPICLGTTVLLQAMPSAGTGVYTSFVWAGPGGYMAAVQNPPGFVATLGTVGTYTVTVTDNAGCTGTGTVAVSLENNDPPTIDCPAGQIVAANGICAGVLGNWVGFATNVTDDCTAPANIIVTQMPGVGTPMSGHDDEETVTLTADDGTGNMTSCTFKVTLKDLTAPTITCPADQTVAADGACTGVVGNRVSLATNITDNCTATPTVTQMPAAGTVLSGHDDEEIVTLTADDGHGNTTPCTFKVILKDVTPPTITCPANQTVAADAVCSGIVGDRIGLATNVTDNCNATPAVTQMPAAGTVLSGHNDEEIVTLTANDGHGNTTPCTFKVILKDVTPPMITCPNPVLVSCFTQVPAPNTSLVIASDNCSAVVKSHVFDSAPYDVTCINRFKVTRTYRATDVVGNSADCTQLITVYDATAPTLLFVPANVTVQCNAIPAVGNPSAVDNCLGDVSVAYNGQTVSNIICDDTYTLTRKWTATDACGNTKTATQRITVRDTQKPVFTSVPANVTVQCDAVPMVGSPAATDNCDKAVSITYNGEIRTNGFCPDTYTLTRRWTAVDNCSNTRTATQVITVRDTQKPVFMSVPGPVTIECTMPIPAVVNPTATDNCDTSVSVILVGEWTMNATCSSNYQIMRMWQATDNCSNSTVASQIITVQDTQAPAFTSVPDNVTIECSDLVPPIGDPTATDACGGYVQITFLGQTSVAGSCPYSYVITRVWRAEDLCGNSLTASHTITVQDTQAPTFNSPPANVTVVCADIPGVPAVTAQDNCGPATVTYQGQTQTPGDCAAGYTITRTWTANDQCGHTTTHSQYITVLPSLQSPGEDRVEPFEPGKGADSHDVDFRISPNPSSGAVRVDLSDFAGASAHLAIFNNLGVMVWEQRLQTVPDAAIQFNLREQKNLQAGVYQVVLESGGKRFVKTLVLMD